MTEKDESKPVEPTDYNENKPVRDDVIETEVGAKEFESPYLSFKEGEEVEMVLEKVVKVEGKDPDFNLSNVNYNYELRSKEGKTLTISTWAAWKAFREMLRTVSESMDPKDLYGKKIKGFHPKRGKYSFEVIE